MIYMIYTIYIYYTYICIYICMYIYICTFIYIYMYIYIYIYMYIIVYIYTCMCSQWVLMRVNSGLQTDLELAVGTTSHHPTCRSERWLLSTCPVKQRTSQKQEASVRNRNHNLISLIISYINSIDMYIYIYA